MPKRELFDCSVLFIHSTEHAIGVSEDGGATTIWFPKSVCEYDKNSFGDPITKKDGTFELTVPVSWASQKGLAGA